MDINKDNTSNDDRLKNDYVEDCKTITVPTNNWKDSIKSGSINLHDNNDQMSDVCSNLPSRLPSITLKDKTTTNSQISLSDSKSNNNSLSKNNISIHNNHHDMAKIEGNHHIKCNIKDLEINEMSFDVTSANSHGSTPLLPQEKEKDLCRQSSMSEEYFLKRVRRKDVNDEGLFLSYHSSLRKPRTTEGIMAFEFSSDNPSVAVNTPFIIPFYDSDSGQEELREDSSCLSHFCTNIRGDESSLALLLVLYFLQGIPLGIISCIPYMLSERNVSFTDQSFFSFSSYPFSAKLLWAPIVDAFYIRKIGRRKTWLIPVQFLISVYLLVLSFYISDLIPDDSTKSMTVSIKILTLLFLPLNFLAATQDIAVDGWALTMLSRKNVGYASTCNVIGQHAGLFLGNNVFMFLSSEKYANRFFRNINGKGGLINFAEFLLFWGAIFFITTTLVLFFKKEVDHSKEDSEVEHKKHDISLETNSIKNNNLTTIAIKENDEEIELGVGETYLMLFKIILLKPMLLLLFVLFTNKLSFAATYSTTFLKLVDAGVKKEDISMLNVFLSPLSFVLPIFVGKFTVGENPLNLLLYAYPFRLFMNFIYGGLLYTTPWFKDESGEFPYYFYGIWLFAMFIHDSLSITMFLSIMAFFAKISDPKIGGTYMTMLNTISNLGGMMSSTFVMFIIDLFTVKNCYVPETRVNLGTCKKSELQKACVGAGNSCEYEIDGYYLTVGLGTIYGIIWIIALWSRIKRFQKIPRTEWLVFKKKN
ncbi:Major facilitator superfamily domain, general substrate transporter and Acetyl-coenzyme A transporter 1 family-containing protein [Strongyloides ratti]|uniref:Major facilitator superfamily domain, general substrate transporter and Acetyl-coenzyme A transporter 1 family-containing protein n=1 Tax=Strongyloides ratti TaxID=34506 RepID=A0A090KV52_STRRB|nr:Major facilitator superfamily domain, general substrate transporter and Acetyl-coenzyme A transporter 1 family-containing protein [Strongyloides ratti]CEF59710.1 Major facilitator superfamily domain, general substrate transporter and Acetyl-coenzyme A transporter 1 family-containing protein [Strongyloides ratti]